jgi:hypothetical protein
MPVKVKGAAQLNASLARAGRRLEDMPPTVHRRAGAAAAALISAAAPRRTGHLARSFRVVAAANGADISSAVGYGGYVNYGTRHMRARRFVDRGLDAAADPVATIYQGEVDKALSQVRGA